MKKGWSRREKENIPRKTTAQTTLLETVILSQPVKNVTSVFFKRQSKLQGFTRYQNYKQYYYRTNWIFKSRFEICTSFHLHNTRYRFSTVLLLDRNEFTITVRAKHAHLQTYLRFNSLFLNYASQSVFLTKPLPEIY